MESMFQQQELPIGQNPYQMITTKQIGISVIVGLLLSVFFNSGPYFGEKKYFVDLGTQRIEITEEKYWESFNDTYIHSGEKGFQINVNDVLIEHKTKWDNIFYGFLTYLFITSLIIGFIVYNKSRRIKKTLIITSKPELTNNIVPLAQLNENHLVEQQSIKARIKPTLEEYMSREKPIPNDSSSSAKILYFSLAIASFCILLFLLSFNKKKPITNTEETETISNTIKYKGVNEYIHEMNSGKTQIFSVKDHPKAHGADWQMTMPYSFNIIQGNKTHVISKIGTKDFNPDITMGIGAHKLNIPAERSLSNEEIENLFNDPSVFTDIIQDNGNFLTGEKIIIDGVNPGYMSEIEYNFTNIDNSMKMRSLFFMFIVNKVLFTFSCNVSSTDLNENLQYKMDENREFYKLIANTIIINRKEPNDNQSISKDSFSKGIVNLDNVNLRTVGELSSHIVAIVNKGEEFYIVQKSEEVTTIQSLGTHYWYLVENDNYKGWIFGKFLDLE